MCIRDRCIKCRSAFNLSPTQTTKMSVSRTDGHKLLFAQIDFVIIARGVTNSCLYVAPYHWSDRLLVMLLKFLIYCFKTITDSYCRQSLLLFFLTKSMMANVCCGISVACVQQICK